MNQIKYVLYAVSLLAVVFFCGSFLSKISGSVYAKEETSMATNMEATAKTVVSSKGKSLFQQNCQSCHALDRRLTGPALRGFTERGPWTDKTNIYAWIKNPAAFMQKDAYTQALKNEYGVIMQAFPALTPEEIDDIIEYTTTP